MEVITHPSLPSLILTIVVVLILPTEVESIKQIQIEFSVSFVTSSDTPFLIASIDSIKASQEYLSTPTLKLMLLKHHNLKTAAGIQTQELRIIALQMCKI
ncbi:hypothetical protein CsatB_001289 [Cannabis sativa]